MSHMKNTDVGSIVFVFYDCEQNAVGNRSSAAAINDLPDFLLKAGLLWGNLTVRHKGKRCDGFKQSRLPVIGNLSVISNLFVSKFYEAGMSRVNTACGSRSNPQSVEVRFLTHAAASLILPFLFSRRASQSRLDPA